MHGPKAPNSAIHLCIWIVPIAPILFDSEDPLLSQILRVHLFGSNRSSTPAISSDYPVMLSSEFKEYGWEVTGPPKSSRAVEWQMMKSLLWHAGRGLLVAMMAHTAKAGSGRDQNLRSFI